MTARSHSAPKPDYHSGLPMRETMAIGKQFQPEYGLSGVAYADGFPWPRLATGVFAVAISLAMSWRAEPTPVEFVRLEAPQPRQEQLAIADSLDEGETEIVEVRPLREMAPAPTAPPQLESAPAWKPSGAPKPQLQRTAKVQTDRVAHRKAGANRRSGEHEQIAKARLTRTRAELRNEYIASREQVAALTSEDSGSAYLARQAARRNAERTAHAHDRSQASRRTPARS